MNNKSPYRYHRLATACCGRYAAAIVLGILQCMLGANELMAQESSWLQQDEPLPGITKPEKESRICPVVDGVLAHVFVKEGERVKRGQLLAVLDQRIAQASLKVAQLECERLEQLDVMQSREQLAKARVDQLREMQQQGAASQQQSDEARMTWLEIKADLVTLREQLSIAKAKAALANQQLSSHEIRAPFDGIIMRIEAREGEKVDPSKGLLFLASIERLKLEIYVPINRFAQLHLGHEYPVKLPLLENKTVFGKLIHREQAIDVATGTFRCVFEIENSTSTLPLGLTAELQISNQIVDRESRPRVAPASFN